MSGTTTASCSSGAPGTGQERFTPPGPRAARRLHTGPAKDAPRVGQQDEAGPFVGHEQVGPGVAWRRIQVEDAHTAPPLARVEVAWGPFGDAAPTDGDDLDCRRWLARLQQRLAPGAPRFVFYVPGKRCLQRFDVGDPLPLAFRSDRAVAS